MSNNPLKSYFRVAKLTVELPSKMKWYNDDVIDTSLEQIDILPMTAADEVTLKNPDQLLNGKALESVILSCVPSVKKPSMLISNDVDVLITAIRSASFNDKIDVVSTCPNSVCGHENKYQVDISELLETIEYLEDSYEIETRSGLKIEVSPLLQKDTLDIMKAQFEQTKMAKSLQQNMSEEDILSVVSRTYDSVLSSNVKLVTNCISKITTPDGQEVTDKENIMEFIRDVDSKTFGSIKNKIKDISNIGIKKTFTAKCEKCDHTWETDLDFNPIDFFTES